MVAGNTEESSLGSARGRFLEGLSRKAIELRGAVALLTESPGAEGPRDDLLRRLNALLASSLVFRNDVLAQALTECIERLDAAREQQRSLDAGELELLAALVRRLPELRGEPPREEPFALAHALSSHAESAQLVAHAGELGPSHGRFSVEPRDGAELASQAAQELSTAPADDDIERAIDQLALAEGPAPTFTPRAPSELAQELADDLGKDEPREESTPAPLLAHGQPLLQRVLHVLVITTEHERRDLLDALRSDSVRVSLVDGMDELLASVRDDTPDLVLADEQLAQECGLIVRLRDEAQADFVPVVLIGGDAPLAGDAGDARIARPFMAHELIRALGSATGTLVDALAPSDIGALTVEEVAERVADEVRHGLVASATQGRLQQVPLGHGADVMAATFHAISELRSAIVRESGGRVRFSARPPERGPALVIPGVEPVSEQERKLFGRRILLVEGDTAIVLLLANVLRAHGATVRELTNGREALAAALHERPDLIVAGARVPELDAFALTRELAREPLLSDVPLLLLPSKEQLLTRGKEQSSLALDVAAQIVATAVALLAPRREIEERLRAPGHVRGTLEGTGVVALLRSVRRTRPDARICIRDPWNLFECELREGRLAQITRTACDGSFVRNDRALPQLLGTRAARFVVREGEGPLKISFDGTLDEVLTRGAQQLGAQIAALTGARLDRVARVVFDGDAYALLVQLTPRAVRSLIERLHGGEAPLKLLRSGAVERDVLEPLLVDMARRGALCGVLGSAGQDLVVEALHEREGAQPIELASPLSIVPPPPNPVISVLPSGTDTKPLSAPRRADTASRPSEPPSARPELKSAASRAREASVSDASELAAAQAEARRSRSTIAAWSVALLALGVVGVLVAREPGTDTVAVEAIGGPAAEPTPVAPALAPAPAAPIQDSQGLVLYDEIRDGVSVAPDQGLVIVEAVGTLLGATVWVDERLLGTPPLRTALPAGVHELAIKRGDAMSYRFVTVHPGKTWVLRDP
jgi:DNA-binding response OmpR family regulator